MPLRRVIQMILKSSDSQFADLVPVLRRVSQNTRSQGLSCGAGDDREVLDSERRCWVQRMLRPGQEGTQDLPARYGAVT